MRQTAKHPIFYMFSDEQKKKILFPSVPKGNLRPVCHLQKQMYLLNRLRYVLRHILYLSICLFFLYFSEPITFVGEGEYKINVVKMITVTDSFLELHQSDRGCQNEESFDTCTTRLYSDNIFKKCGCYIFNSMLPNKVMIFKTEIILQN